jgi:hypothetical protein
MPMQRIPFLNKNQIRPLLFFKLGHWGWEQYRKPYVNSWSKNEPGTADQPGGLTAIASISDCRQLPKSIIPGRICRLL